jgi:hypothetical protein
MACRGHHPQPPWESPASGEAGLGSQGLGEPASGERARGERESREAGSGERESGGAQGVRSRRSGEQCLPGLGFMG